MKKIIPQVHEKPWGKEIWLNSTIKGMETFFENGEKCSQGPLIKILDVRDNLSIQVHPDDELAMKLENQKFGKTESWYILKTNEDSKLVLGLKNYDEKYIRESLDNDTFVNNLKYIHPKEGHFINVPAGLVHSIGPGNIILEVQEECDITYRYYDYNRTFNGQKRELNIDKSIISQKDISWELSPISTNPITYDNGVAKQVFSRNKIRAKFDCIVVDFDTYNCYFVNSGEDVDFKDFALISITEFL